MVTAPEAVALLAHASGFDNRKPDPMTVRAWGEALASVDFQEAMGVITRHYQVSRDWIMPSDILREVRRIEAERIANGPNVDELELPEWLTAMEDGPEFVALYRDWLQEMHRRIRRGLPLDGGVGDPVQVSSRQWNALVS